MSKNIKNKISSFITSIIEKSVLGYFSNIKKGILELIDNFPENATRLYYIYAALLLIVSISAAGVTIITIGVVLVIIALADDTVNKFLLSGILLTLAGSIYFTGTMFIIKLIGNILHASLAKSADKMLKRVE